MSTCALDNALSMTPLPLVNIHVSLFSQHRVWYPYAAFAVHVHQRIRGPGQARAVRVAQETGAAGSATLQRMHTPLLRRREELQ